MIESLKRLWALLEKKERRSVITLFGIGSINAFLQVAALASMMPFVTLLINTEMAQTNKFFKAIYDLFGLTNVNQLIVALGSIAFIIMLSSNLFRALNIWMTFRFGYLYQHKLSTRLLSNYLKRPFEQFQDIDLSEMSKNIVTEVERVVIGTVFWCILVFTYLSLTGFLVLLLVIVNIKVTFYTLLCLAISYYLISLLIKNRIATLGAEVPVLEAAKFKKIQEALSSQKEIGVAGKREFFTQRFSDIALRSANNLISFKSSQELPLYLLEAVAFGILIGMTVLIALNSEDGVSSAIPTIALYGFAAYRLIPSVKGVFNGWAEIKYNIAALDGIEPHLREMQNEIDDNATALSIKKSITVSKLSYTYKGKGTAALDNINLTINHGESICLVGRSGAGKSTLFNVLLGILETKNGKILIDDTALNSANLGRWQKNIGLVPQSVRLLDESIINNVAFGVAENDIDRDRVIDVLKLVNLQGFIENNLADKYDTNIGEDGQSLSGGQRQRLGIARALYQDPDVLMLDEATSALDPESEADLIKVLFSLSGKTIITVSHRPAFAAACDRVALIHDGRITDTGKLSELQDRNKNFGHYFDEKTSS